MAAKFFSLTDAAVPEQWAREVYRAASWKSLLLSDRGFMGAPGDSDTMVTQVDEFKKSGGEVTCTLVHQIGGMGVKDEERAEGREVSFKEDTFKFEVHLLRNGTGIRGDFSPQLVPWDMGQAGKKGLADWWTTTLNMWAFTQLCGFTTTANAGSYYTAPGARPIYTDSDFKQTGMNATAAPTSGRVFRPNSVADDESLSSSDTFSLELLDEFLARAPQADPPIRPAKFQGGYYYLCFIHGDQNFDLQQTAEYKSVSEAQLKGGQSYADNAYGTGNIRAYKNVLIFSTNFISPGVHSSTAAILPDTRRAIICGAQALSWGWGKGYSSSKMKWTQEPMDRGAGVAFWAGAMSGCKKIQHTPLDAGAVEDYGMYTIPTYAANRA